MKKWTVLFVVIACAVFASLCFCESAYADDALASDIFRVGVQAYYRGSYNDAVTLFEKALSRLPSENTIIEWLGKAYYKSGLEGTALQQWEAISNTGYGGLVLKNKIDIVRSRRNAITGTSSRFVESGSFPSRSQDTVFYIQPSAVAPLPDGTCWVAAYGSNEIIHFDINGVILTSSRGPSTGFRRPMDVVVLDDGRLLVSEYAAHRISVLSKNGLYEQSFGSKGRGVGQFSGPQYIAYDSNAIYVTDFGNARVVVFSREFKPLFTFGEATGTFKGIKNPSGIAVIDNVIYVADQASGNFHMFDCGGNYIGSLLDSATLKRPESVKVDRSCLLVADENQILSIDPVTAQIHMVSDIGKGAVRLTSAAKDCNGNIIATDFVGEQVLILSDMTDLVGGMFVQVERIISDQFPRVVLEVSVEDRRRNPVTGLKARNFYLTEEHRPAALVQFDAAAYLNDYVDVTVLVERSNNSAEYEQAQKSAIAELAAAMPKKGNFRVISAGELPVLEYEGNPQNAMLFAERGFKAKPSASWNFDLGLRLAANKCVSDSQKRGILFLTIGSFNEQSFKRYGLTDLSAYLNNNSIVFSAIRLTQGAISSEINYVIDQTGGKSYYVFRPEGLSAVITDMIQKSNGHYFLSYTSSLPTDFGRSFLPVEIEVYLMNRSGRDHSGYFAPLE